MTLTVNPTQLYINKISDIFRKDPPPTAGVFFLPGLLTTGSNRIIQLFPSKCPARRHRIADTEDKIRSYPKSG